jgi:hypothetical protein
LPEKHNQECDQQVFLETPEKYTIGTGYPSCGTIALTWGVVKKKSRRNGVLEVFSLEGKAGEAGDSHSRAIHAVPPIHPERCWRS